MARQSKYSPEFKERSVRVARESERSIPEIARDLGISYETLRIWVRQAEADDGTRGASQGEPRPAKIKRNPKSGECFFRPRTRPAPSKVSAFIDGCRDRFGVEPICREIEASASAYRARRIRPPSARAVRDEYLLKEIKRVHAASGDVYGQLKVWDELRDEDIAVARCTVERLMRNAGLEGCRNGKVMITTRPGLNPVPAADLVRRDFTADRPDAVWLSDFTYIRTWEGWSYLAIVLDVYTRRIVGWQLTSHMRQSLVTDALEMALVSRQEHNGGLIVHSDNGSQYTSYEYTARLTRAGIAPSRGRTGTALDNAMAESIMSTLKRELTKRYTWRTRLDLELALVTYIGWYNARRKHRSLTVVNEGRVRRQTPLEALNCYTREIENKTLVPIN